MRKLDALDVESLNVLATSVPQAVDAVEGPVRVPSETTQPRPYSPPMTKSDPERISLAGRAAIFHCTSTSSTLSTERRRRYVDWVSDEAYLTRVTASRAQRDSRDQGSTPSMPADRVP